METYCRTAVISFGSPALNSFVVKTRYKDSCQPMLVKYFQEVTDGVFIRFKHNY